MSQTKKILIMEDEKILREMFSGKLKREGFEVLSAKDGLAGYKLALEQKPDLILLDLLMPRMDGVTTFRKLREDKWGNKVQIIVLTNLSKYEVKGKIKEEGPTEYLIKAETEPKEVIKKIKEKLADD